MFPTIFYPFPSAEAAGAVAAAPGPCEGAIPEAVPPGPGQGPGESYTSQLDDVAGLLEEADQAEGIKPRFISQRLHVHPLLLLPCPKPTCPCPAPAMDLIQLSMPYSNALAMTQLPQCHAGPVLSLLLPSLLL